MSTSVLRTTDAWWVVTPTGAAKVETTATTTGQLLADRQAVVALRQGDLQIPVRPRHKLIDLVGGDLCSRGAARQPLPGRPQHRLAGQPGPLAGGAVRWALGA